MKETSKKNSKSKVKIKINYAVLSISIVFVWLIAASGITLYKYISGKVSPKYIESSAYIDTNGMSNLVSGVENGGVYISAVTPVISKNVKEATLTLNGEELKFKSGKKISKLGSYILVLEDDNKNIDTIYFDIEY